MDRILNRLIISYKALREIGPRQLSLYALYKLGLLSGHYRRATQSPKPNDQPYMYNLHPVLELPDPDRVAALLGEMGLLLLTDEADEIVAGKCRLFGGNPVPLVLSSPAILRHWTEYENHPNNLGDLKFIWEPARFGWAFTLGRAFWLTQDERYPQAFWRYTEEFWDANPPYMGPNWISAQEAALRLCAFVFAAQVFAASTHTTPPRLSRLAESIAEHAVRIPPTLVYARAQNNNHLISEALGLYTAAAALPDHPRAQNWQHWGWHWLNRAFQNQIAPNGAYSQHSTNYHRLMLQAALWAQGVGKVAFSSQFFPPQTLAKLQAATSWLLALLDPISARVPNLGPNDGALIFPLSSSPFHDFRPVLQSAARVFFGGPAFSAGLWDESSLWLGQSPLRHNGQDGIPTERLSHHNQTVIYGSASSWAYLRATRFTSRPGHADQLHLDLWWRGMNLAKDPGTYRYTADIPWDNAFTTNLVHNTLSVDGRDQMTRTGRFLYLDWAQAQLLERSKGSDGSWKRLCAKHNGYRKFGITHQRQVTAYKNGCWQVDDELQGSSRTTHTACLHWLMPDLPWEADVSAQNVRLRLSTPHGTVELSISAEAQLEPVLVRAGKPLLGQREIHPTWGWTSPTYGDKIPALALFVYFQGMLPLQISSQWILPNETS